jgi:UDP-N-acetylmuramate dehydrogenase
MEIQYSINLKPYNTFGIDAFAQSFSRFSTVEELKFLLSQKEKNTLFILGGGSNILLTKDIDAFVLRNEIKGIEVNSRTGDSVVLKVGAGEVWHDFVVYCVDHQLAGIENLSLIPGSVGASPMQNIGAYGVEVKDVIEQVEALHIETMELHTFSNTDCQFGYRESVFKRALKGQYIITQVYFKLSTNPNINTAYGAIESELKTKGIKQASIKDVSNAVIAIRKSKLPDPKQIGNAGSFFKNPVISISLFDKIKNHHPSVPYYPAEPGFVKVPAGWLIEQAGWKGKTMGNCGVHKNQALVLVNYGGATGKEIWDLSSQIVADIEEKFGIELEREVNVY